MEKKNVIKKIYIKIKELIDKILGKEEVKMIEEKTEKVENKLVNSLKVEKNNSELVSLKYKLSNKEISVNDLDNDTVKKLIEMYKQSNKQLEQRIMNGNY